MHARSPRFRRAIRGFSLAEATITVAILGVLTALALPLLSQVTANSSESKGRRLARELASMAASAVAAGDSSIPLAPDAEAAVRLLVGGVTITEGIAGMHFQMRHLTESQIERVVPHLRMEGGILVYADSDDGRIP